MSRKYLSSVALSALCGTTAPLSGCIGGKGTSAAVTAPPAANTLDLTVDTGPAAAPGAINHAYVTVKVCAAGSTAQCASIDHVLLDTGSVGLRFVESVLTAHGVTLKPSTDAQGSTVEECARFSAGQSWGPIALADVSLAGEVAANLPVQILADTGGGAPAPANCGANGTLLDSVAALSANGLLGVGVFVQDCGPGCVTANGAAEGTAYYGCTGAGVCGSIGLAIADQVTNPVALFPVDNNGVIVDLPNLQNANGDAAVLGQLLIGIGTQTDDQLPLTGLTVLGTNAAGEFSTTFNGSTTTLAGRIDSGSDSIVFDDPQIPVCSSGAFVGYYCPTVAPMSVYAINNGLGTNAGVNTVNFAIADPNTFVAGASAFTDLAGGAGSSGFVWGMPFFYGRKVYVGIDQRIAGTYTGPYFAY